VVSLGWIVTHAQRVAAAEIFGPVLSVMTFRAREEAFECANNIPYGLSAGEWTINALVSSRIFRFTRAFPLTRFRLG
jgi:acyl-CoA reductase-like NAD-dependent aldehyde dehydrogenase